MVYWHKRRGAYEANGVILVLCMVLVLSFFGCSSDDSVVALKDGHYFLVGEYEEHLTPYLWLDTEDQTFYFGAGLIYSYAERGTYEIKDNTLIATSQNTTFIFEIVDENTLILADNGDSEFFKLPKDSKFVYSED